MALEVATAYRDLAACVQPHLAPEQYKQQLEREFYTEYTLMDKCSKSQNIIGCYCVSFIGYKRHQQM